MSTLDYIIRRTALELLLQEDYEDAIDWFWDLKFVYMYGLPVIDPPDFPPDILIDYNKPQPDPLPDTLVVNLLSQLVDLVAADPSPQPSITAVLNDREARLAAAERFAGRLSTALDQVNEEIEQLRG